jgi:hypothetical protein
MSGGGGSQNDAWSVTGTNSQITTHWYELQGETPQEQVSFALNTNNLWAYRAPALTDTSPRSRRRRCLGSRLQ